MPSTPPRSRAARRRGTESRSRSGFPVDAPYGDIKSLLLQTVADAGRCRAVYMGSLAMSTLIGFPDDVAAAEMLFTSLLLQAQRALADAAKRAPAGTQVRSQSYRSAFLLAYTTRIGDRLQEINNAIYAEVAAEREARASCRCSAHAPTRSTTSCPPGSAG